ncbi:MAG: NTP pyrophosphohydrolase [Ewingella americana]|jgi:hypothetical protein|uniref:DUF6889 family protein n=1 Tax=Ewingella TaxID=41201 RepID=UPI00243272DB|nr:NTP pyrophosphohydrolase [Ewingella americana]MCI1676636.1 NTP pyrophosphohydrolase [Ewingella americana]MCI1853774.1 NTP pyrophosphohydrolase [Ewingella americana]MCI1859985.1 NTP pyrophosphohydrolase [Ewingella americana]MCI2142313.1 NTP pyrophosphohydrolase [Ewingella americana]MCI2163276.1 NTP pyrophosphohydrolase [Ewingella americana]
MRPVKAGYITYPNLKDGTVDLADIAFMNDCLDLDADNEALIEQWRADNDGC